MRTIRRLVAADAEPLAALLAENRDFLAPFDPRRPESHYTAEWQREWIAGNPHRFGILDGRRLAGTISLSNVAHGFFQSANVGYWVARDRNGKGLASRAVAEIVRYAFDEVGLHRLEAGTLVDNLASQRVLEKNRFEPIGLARRYLLIAGEWRDHLLFQRLADD